jgi:hypothetical protein
MDFKKAINLVNAVLVKKQPKYFGSSWIFKYAPRAYHFFRLNVRTTNDSIDWDTITGELDRQFQKKWTRRRRKRRELLKLYKSKTEVKMVFKKYRDMRYVFIAPANADDRIVRDRVSIALVRIAQKGNISAQQELIELLAFTIENWTERYPYLHRWKYYPDLISGHIETCMRRYRFTGSFIKYLFISLLYSARALKPVKVFSLDQPMYDDSETTLAERVVQNPLTGEIQMYEDGYLHTYQQDS